MADLISIPTPALTYRKLENSEILTTTSMKTVLIEKLPSKINKIENQSVKEVKISKLLFKVFHLTSKRNEDEEALDEQDDYQSSGPTEVLEEESQYYSYFDIFITILRMTVLIEKIQIYKLENESKKSLKSAQAKICLFIFISTSKDYGSALDGSEDFKNSRPLKLRKQNLSRNKQIFECPIHWVAVLEKPQVKF